MTPESVGADSELVLGKHSGKAAYKARLIELGYADVANDEEKLSKVVEGAKAVADQKKVLSDMDLEVLVGDKLYHQERQFWALESLSVQSNSSDDGSKVASTATVKLRELNGEEVSEAAIGIGPVDATFKAILRIVNRPVKLSQYSVTKISGGTNAPGNDALASIVLQITSDSSFEEVPADFPAKSSGIYFAEGNELGVVKSAANATPTFSGTGSSTDIIVASAKAYLGAINRMIDAETPREAAA
eukprot:2946903-Pleurochrysis_carterae.AAC.1